MKEKIKEKKEWTSPYNEFNSLKLLHFKEHLQAIKSGKFLPPITVDVDLTNLCNLKCIWCNAEGFRKISPTSIDGEHAIKLADFFGEWGVKSACIAGGGEPMMNKIFDKFLYVLKTNNVKSGIITNGILMNDDNATAIARCSSWCGISMDAGSSEVYIKVKGIKDESLFDKVIQNIKSLAEIKKAIGSNVEITYKYLMHPYNVKDIYKAALLAKSIGVNTFHLRPVCQDNLYNRDVGNVDFSGLFVIIESEIAKARELEDENFKFYSVRHKFGEQFERKINFKKCLATPLLATFGADGNIHLCFDIRGKKEWILCSHYPDPKEILKVWGSEKHKKIINSINPKKCPRCTFGPYNEIIEKAIIEDKMYLDFI